MGSLLGSFASWYFWGGNWPRRMKALVPGLKSKQLGSDVGLPVGAVLLKGDIDAVGNLGLARSRQLVKNPAWREYMRSMECFASAMHSTEHSWELAG